MTMMTGSPSPGTIAATVVALIAAVALLTWLVRQAEPHLAFFPLGGEQQTPADSGVPYVPYDVETADGERIRLWHVTREAPRAQVVYFHGNGGNLSLWSDVFVALWHRGFDVVALDYRGYGVSTGRPSERGLYQDVDATLTLVHERLRLPGVPLLYWGRSLGTTMAAYAAAERPADGIVLEAGYPSMRAVLETNPLFWLLSWVSSYRLPTAEWMAGVTAPTLVLHGDRDRVIPYRLGQRLHASIPGPKRFVTVTGGDHNDLVPVDDGPYWEAVEEFVRDIARRAEARALSIQESMRATASSSESTRAGFVSQNQ